MSKETVQFVEMMREAFVRGMVIKIIQIKQYEKEIFIKNQQKGEKGERDDFDCGADPASDG